MPQIPSASASADETHSCVFVGSAIGSVRATGSSQFVNGCQNGAHWIQPPITASTVRIPDRQHHRRGSFLPVIRVMVLPYERTRFAGEDEEVETERVEA